MEKLTYEEQFTDPITGAFPGKIDSSALNTWSFNTHTVGKVGLTRTHIAYPVFTNEKTPSKMKTFFVLILMTPFGLFAQSSDVGNWIIYFGDKKINNRWNWHHEVQYRNFNFLGDTEQLLLRTGFGYNITEKNNNIHFGCAYIYSEPYIMNTDNKTNYREYRVYQQFITRQVFGRLSVQHRYRFEQRFLEDDFRLRLRYFLALNVVLNPKKSKNQNIYLSAYNEIFLNTDQNIFDRNRVYGGLGYKFSKKIRTEVGLMNQYTGRVSRNQFNIITFVAL